MRIKEILFVMGVAIGMVVTSDDGQAAKAGERCAEGKGVWVNVTSEVCGTYADGTRYCRTVKTLSCDLTPTNNPRSPDLPPANVKPKGPGNVTPQPQSNPGTPKKPKGSQQVTPPKLQSPSPTSQPRPPKCKNPNGCSDGGKGGVR